MDVRFGPKATVGHQRCEMALRCRTVGAVHSIIRASAVPPIPEIATVQTNRGLG